MIGAAASNLGATEVDPNYKEHHLSKQVSTADSISACFTGKSA